MESSLRSFLAAAANSSNFLMRADGGEASALTLGKTSVGAFEWAPDGKQIAFLSGDAKSEEQERKKKRTMILAW